jgi:hypothetical protein
LWPPPPPPLLLRPPLLRRAPRRCSTPHRRPPYRLRRPCMWCPLRRPCPWHYPQHRRPWERALLLSPTSPSAATPLTVTLLLRPPPSSPPTSLPPFSLPDAALLRSQLLALGFPHFPPDTTVGAPARACPPSVTVYSQPSAVTSSQRAPSDDAAAILAATRAAVAVAR